MFENIDKKNAILIGLGVVATIGAAYYWLSSGNSNYKEHSSDIYKNALYSNEKQTKSARKS
jgi:hypothetical protein